MLDGEETVEIACGELRWEGAREETVRGASPGGSETAWGQSDYSMLDGEETVEIAWGELRWEGARQRAGRRGNRGNSLRKASLGGSYTACWTERKPWK